MSLENSPIPLIDLTSNPSVEDLGAQVLKAASSIGFLFLRLPQDGGLAQEKVNGMFDVAKELFSSPMEELDACKLDADTNGYAAFKSNRLAESAGQADLKANFVIGRHPVDVPGPRSPLPPALQCRKPEVDAFHAACWDLTCQLLDAFSVALNLPQSYFRDRHAQGCSGLSLNNYPAISAGQAADEAASTSRASAHKDWGSLTLLFQEEFGTPGLEVFLADDVVAVAQSDQPYLLMSDVDLTKGKWHAAPVIPHTVLVNLGLAVEAWTSSTLRATLHRVVVQPEPDGGFKQRMSMPYFVQPKPDVVFNPISPDGTIQEVAGAKTSRQFFIDRQTASVKAIEVKAA
ncbi:hypothetical protein JCM6882_008165 [Rhodosporidiobolus microsporus]